MSYVLEVSSKRNVATVVTAVVTAACLTQALISDFAPVYGALPTAGPFETSAYTASFLTWTSILLDRNSSFGMSLLPSTLLVSLSSWLMALERLVLFPLTRYITAYNMMLLVLCPILSVSFFIAAQSMLHTLQKTSWLPHESGLTWWRIATTTVVSILIYFVYQLTCAAMANLWSYCVNAWLLTYVSVAQITLRAPLQMLASIAIGGVLLNTASGRHKQVTVGLIIIGALVSGILYLQTPLLLRRYDYSLLFRGSSETGYISVLENTNLGLRVMRNDHSLLGGTWLLTPERKSQGMKKEESIFSVFYMLEAVRLMEHNEPADVVRKDRSSLSSDSAKAALVIGLGIATAPTALAQHGINTTAVEIDPLVIRLAKTYFNLHSDLTTLNRDALAFTAEALAQNQSYDYIIHDVFTGGSEPEALFTSTFLLTLRQLLKPGGAIAINYAANLPSQTTHQTLHRILTTFPHCTIYRDNPVPAPTTPEGATDFANIIIFCSCQPWHFRAPVNADYLETAGRREALMPKYVVERGVFEREPGPTGGPPGGEMTERERRRERMEDARRHWEIMRGVLPHGVWENY